MIENLNLEAFERRHGPDLTASPIEHLGLLLRLHRLRENPAAVGGTQFWSCGKGAACTLLHHGMLVFGDLDQAACRAVTDIALANGLRRLCGPDKVVRWALKRCARNGVAFSVPMLLRTMILRELVPQRSIVGHGRSASAHDLDLTTTWFGEFQTEALPDLTAPPPARLQARCHRLIEAAGVALWESEGMPVSMATIGRVLPQVAAISAVYTPPKMRGRGFAGAVVGWLSGKILESGRPACLYVDAHNPISTRCYEKIGFVPVAQHADAVRVEAG